MARVTSYPALYSRLRGGQDANCIAIGRIQPLVVKPRPPRSAATRSATETAMGAATKSWPSVSAGPASPTTATATSSSDAGLHGGQSRQREPAQRPPLPRVAHRVAGADRGNQVGPRPDDHLQHTAHHQRQGDRPADPASAARPAADGHHGGRHLGADEPPHRCGQRTDGKAVPRRVRGPAGPPAQDVQHVPHDRGAAHDGQEAANRQRPPRRPSRTPGRRAAGPLPAPRCRPRSRAPG